jgi:hypothetical protein
MTISASIVADSVAPDGTRLTSFQLRYHRFVHSELLTHRAFSRNSSSSRAIPVEKMVQWVKDDPAIPVEWGRNQKGMQAAELLSPAEAAEAELIWLQARDSAIAFTEKLLALGVHKQIANRILEPWHHIAVVLTATQFANWFALRNHKMAQPEIRELAKAMELDYRTSTPQKLANDQWHLPYVSAEERAQHPVEILIKASVARCARVSYMNHDGTAPVLANDIALHDRLAVAVPLHASPAEHQATPLSVANPKLCGNFGRGWVQYRKMLPNECVDVLPWEQVATGAA